MIRGIYLPHKPPMDIITRGDVVAELDFRHKFDKDNKLLNVEIDTPFGSITKSTYKTSRLVIMTYEGDFETNKPLHTLEMILSILTEAIPSYIKCFMYSPNRLIQAIPNIDYGKDSEDIYERFIEELIRFTMYQLKSFGPENRDYIITSIQEYIEICVTTD